MHCSVCKKLLGSMGARSIRKECGECYLKRKHKQRKRKGLE